MKAASALGAKTARACDSCLRRRARWFCAADDAFLCHGCDNLVHSANQLASRHERVRLQTASSKVTAQAWHSGFTRKARTPRQGHKKHLVLRQRLKDEVLFNNNTSTLLPVVPELGVEELEPLLDDETEEQLLCRVPVFDPFDADLCNMYGEVRDDERLMDHTATKDNTARDQEAACDLDSFSDFLPSEMDLAEFAADVESLLGSGVDEDSGEMVKGSKLFDNCKEEDEIIDAYGGVEAKSSPIVRVKDEELEDGAACCMESSVLDMTSEAFDWNIDSLQSPAAAAAKEEEEKAVVPGAVTNDGDEGKVGTKREMFLRLNYEEVITAWASQGSPWTTGNPPKFNSDDPSWPNCLGTSGADVQCSSYGDVRSLRGHLVGIAGDGGREARVSRYREKRRTRLFAKKIRYEVRKLNAEKRPRMKGRFVKRTSFVGAATAFPAYH